MVIYKQYVRKSKAFLSKSERAYQEFLRELKFLYLKGIRKISSDTLHFYIRRHSYFLIRRNMKNYWNEKARRYYFMFWIKRAESSGFIKQDNLSWILTDKILKVENGGIIKD
jgi:hypothetical protein